MSNYMKGWSKRKPFNANPVEWNMKGFFSAPVRHLIESLERESALEKPYLDYGPPNRKHQLPGSGQVRRWRETSSYPISDKWKVEYNKPECSLFIYSMDCDETPLASISIDYRSGWQTGTSIYFGVGCNRPDLIAFGETHYNISLNGETVAENTTGVQYSIPWSSATIEGRWLQEISDPLKMSCKGYVAYQGGWAKSEIKYGRTIVTQSVLVESNSMTPGSMSITGTNPITGARGTSVHTLRELGLDPDTVSLDGHNAVTIAAQLYAQNAAVQGNSFNNYISDRAINELTRVQKIERLDWFNTPGMITAWWPGFIECPSVDVDVSCKDEKCEDTSIIGWDSGTSAEEITAGGASVTVAIIQGTPPFTWEVVGDGFSLAYNTTTGRSNNLSASANACGAAIIKVTDGCLETITGVVRETGGINTNWTVESQCGPFDDGVFYGYGITEDGYIAADDWCGDDGITTCEESCQDNCTQLVPDSIKAVTEGVTPCHVESNRIYSWTCN